MKQGKVKSNVPEKERKISGGVGGEGGGGGVPF